jgi:GNAT superfamily N-acetyltransferase
VESEDPNSPEALALLGALSETLERVTGSSGRLSFEVGDVLAARSCFAIARTADGLAVGCGALRGLDPQVAELKRMFAMPGTAGVGRAVLAYLERRASDFGYREIWLETRQVNRRAVAFYERNGYQAIPNFGRYVNRPEAVCFGKHLPGSTNAIPSTAAGSTHG